MISLNLQGGSARFCAEVCDMLTAPLGTKEPGHHISLEIILFVIVFFAFAYLSFFFLTGSGCRQCRFFFLRQFGSGPSAT
jgi:hypothetical protein